MVNMKETIIKVYKILETSDLNSSEITCILEIIKFNVMMNSGLIVIDGKPLHEIVRK